VPAGLRYTFTSSNELFRRMLGEPKVAGPMRRRYRALLEGPLSAEQVLALLDTFAAEIQQAALRDEARWGKQYRTFSRWADRDDFLSHEQEVKYLRAWIEKRWRALGKRLPGR
jgi:spore coat protein CotH